MSVREMIAQSNYGDAITIEMHYYYAVIREADEVLAVVGQDGGFGPGVALFDSIEQCERVQGV